jgi:hypothetical protein
MSSVAISSIVFACVFGGVVIGMFLRTALPEQHLSAESKETVRLGMGLVATMAAMVLGLLVASAKSSYDTQNNELTEASSKFILLDRILAHYGPEAKEARGELRAFVLRALDSLGTLESSRRSQLGSTKGEVLYETVQRLSPQDDAQRSLKAQALGILITVGQTRWLTYEQQVNSVTTPLLVVLIFWLIIIFMGFGLFAPRNATAVTSLFVSALSVSGAIFLILEMYTPYAGLIHIQSATLRAALTELGK